MPDVLIHGAMFHLEGSEVIAAEELLADGRMLAIATMKQARFYASLAKVNGVPLGGITSIHEYWNPEFLNRSLCASVDECLSLARHTAQVLENVEEFPWPWIPLPRSG
jgi:hypothetical protein